VKKAILLIVAAGALSAALATYHLPLEGEWVDELVSDVVSKQTGTASTFSGVSIIHWNRVRFQLLVVADENKNPLIVAGSGSARLEPLALLTKDFDSIDFSAEDVALLEALYRSTPILSWAAGSAFKEPIVADRVRFRATQKNGKLSGRLLGFESDALRLKGGIVMKEGKLEVANVIVAFPPDRVERLPKELRARMIHLPSGWREVRVTFRDNTLTAMGTHGKFFQASWKTKTP
jgi:autotransporter translocation and assembly factor TamB